MSLEALERNDWAHLPGGIFTRAFVRSYAEEVGLDPDRTVQDFLAELPAAAAIATSRPVVTEDSEQLESDRQAVTTAFRLVLISIPIIAAVIYLSTQRSSTARNRLAAATEEPAGAQPARIASDTLQSTPDATPAAGEPVAAPPQSSGLKMEIGPKAACWVSVTVDGEPTFSSLMNAGERRLVIARDEVLVTVGDAGAFAYTLNGRAGKPLGAPGEVVSKRITLANYKELVTP
jgi:cytoskeleton protein RodZ